MTMRVLCGRKYNLYERGIVNVDFEHAQLTKDRLFDGRPSRAYRSASLEADQYLKVDGNLLTDGVTNFGGFEAWSGGSPTGWTEANSGTGDVSQETTIKNSGASSAKFTTGTGYGLVFRDVVVKSGEIINISSALRGDGTGRAVLRIQNLLTHKYLDSGGNWAASVVNYRTQTAASWSVVTAAIAVESYAACQSDLVTLRLEVFGDTPSQVSYADDVYVWPRINFMSVHGHNFDPGVGVEFRSSTDNFSASTVLEGTAVVTVPSFYVLLGTAIDRRYWTIRVDQVNSAFVEIGEAVIGYVNTPLRNYSAPVESGSHWDRQASVTPGGERHVHKRSKWQVRNKVFHYKYLNRAQYDDGLELFHQRPEGDTYPVVIVPDTTLSEVIHGRLETTLADARILEDVYFDVTVVLSESPFASSAF